MTYQAGQPGMLHVLVVDDDKGSRVLMAKVFREFGHVVVEAQDGAAAMETLRATEQPFDLMVLDIEMPNMDGLEVTRRVRSGMPPLRELPILGVTALADPSDAARILRAGCDAYLSKPVSIDEVQVAAQQLLDEGRDRAAPHAFADALERHREREA